MFPFYLPIYRVLFRPAKRTFSSGLLASVSIVFGLQNDCLEYFGRRKQFFSPESGLFNGFLRSGVFISAGVHNVLFYNSTDPRFVNIRYNNWILVLKFSLATIQMRYSLWLTLFQIKFWCQLNLFLCTYSSTFTFTLFLFYK